MPTIKSFRGSVEEIRTIEMEKALKRLENGGDAKEVIEQLSRGLANKYSHAPCQALKQADQDGNAGLVSAARKLFDIE